MNGNAAIGYSTSTAGPTNGLAVSGNVGIGTTAPSSLFEVNVGSVAGWTRQMNVINTSATGLPYAFIGDSSNRGLALGHTNNSGAGSYGWLTYVGLDPTAGVGLIVNSVGNIGIGTTAPGNLLHVYGSFNGEVGAKVNNANTGTSAYTILRVANDTASNMNLFLNSSTRTTDGGTNTGTLRNDAGALQLQGSGAKGITIAATSGNVGIGTTSPTAALEVQDSTIPLRLRNNASTAGAYWQIGPNSGNSLLVYNQNNVGVWLGNGGNTWSSTSDIRLKKNFSPISNALEKTLQLRGLTYQYKTDADTDPRRVGVIAQDVQRVLPEAVSEHEGILGVKYTEIIPILIEAIKDLKNKIDLRFEAIVTLSAIKDAQIADLQRRAENAEAESAQLKAFLCSQFPDAPMCR